MRASLVRFTVVDAAGTTSFLGPGHAIKMLAAACSRNPQTVQELLEFTRPYDPDFVTEIRHGLARFDEHNTPDDLSAFQAVAEQQSPDSLPPFRVFDELTRDLSLRPARLGLVLYNLKARRIVQLVNAYGALLREDRGRVRRSGQPTSVLYSYQLPHEWQIVP